MDWSGARRLVGACLVALLLAACGTPNAPVVARERGIQIIESTNEAAGDYSSLMRITVECEGRTRTVAGTLFANQKPRALNLLARHTRRE